MPLKTPWPNAIGGFVEGLEGGMKMGLLRRQQNLAEQESLAKAAAEKEKAEYERDITTFDKMNAVMADENTADESSAEAYKVWADISNKRFKTNLPTTIEWQKEYNKVAKQIQNIRNNENYSPQDKVKLSMDIFTSASKKAQERLEPAFKQMQGEAEQSALTGAANLRGIIENYPQLSEDTATRDSMLTDYNRLAIEGKATPEQMLFKGAEGKEKDYTQTIDLISPQDGKKHRYGYNPDTKKYDRDMGLSEQEKPVKDAYKANAVLTRIVDKFNADPNVRKFGSMENFATIIVDASLSNNPVAHASLETLMARASGEVGNLSEADKKPFGGSRALDAKISQYFSEIYSGKKTPENLEFIRQLANTFIETSRKQKEATARVRAKQYAAANKGMFTPDEIFDALSPDSGDYEEKKDTKKSTPSGGKSKEVTFNPQTGRFE